MKSSIRMVARRICLRKGVCLTTLCVFGFFTVYHFSHTGYEDGVQVDTNPRNVKVVRYQSLT